MILKRNMVSKKQRSTKRNNSLKKFHRTILRLKSLPSRHRLTAVSHANDSFIRQLCSQVNRLKHRQLTPKEHKVIKTHKLKFRKLTDKRTTVANKRRVLSQRGGFINLLLPLVTSLGGALLSGAFGR